MRTVSQEEFDSVLEDHARWLEGARGGKQAEFFGVTLNKLEVPAFSSLENIVIAQSKIYDMVFFSVNFTGAEFYKNKVEDCGFSRSVFFSTNLYRTKFKGCLFPEQVSFTGANLGGTYFNDCGLRGARFNQANLQWAQFQYCDLSWAQLPEILAQGTAFANSVLVGTSFNQANLKEALFDKCDISLAKFRNAKMEKTSLSQVEVSDRTDFSGVTTNSQNFELLGFISRWERNQNKEAQSLTKTIKKQVAEVLEHSPTSSVNLDRFRFL